MCVHQRGSIWATARKFAALLGFACASASMRRRAPRNSHAEKASRAKTAMSLRRSLPHMSQSALAAMVKYAKEHGVDDLPDTRVGWFNARNISLGDTPYGPMILEVVLTAIPPYANRTMLVINPFAYLHVAYMQAGSFHKMLAEKLKNAPCSEQAPWRLALYSDEVVPGNVLRIANARKVWVIYWSFVELHPLLSKEESWVPMIAEPAVGLKQISAGISQVFAKCIAVFFGAFQFDLSSGGIQLTGPDGGRVRLYAELDMMLQDGGAHKHVWCCKGDGGTRICMLCGNLVAHKSGIADEHGEDMLVCSLVHADECRWSTDAEILASVDRLAGLRATESNTDFKKWQQAIGFTDEPHGVLRDPAIRQHIKPSKQYAHDWMHGLFAGGVFNIMFWLLMNAVKTIQPNIWAVFSDYFKRWRFPAAVKFDPLRADLFTPSRIKSYNKAKHVKSTASEGLALLPVLCFFVQSVVLRIHGVCLFACDAMLALGDLVDQLQASQHGLSNADRIRAIVRRMLDQCLKAGWKLFLVPKFHWTTHFEQNVSKWGVALTCFVHERKHKFVKRYAKDVTNLASYSRTVLSEVLSQQLHDVVSPNAFDISAGLNQPIKVASKRVASFLLAQLDLTDGQHEVCESNCARLAAGGVCTRRDVVLFKDGERACAGQVWVLASLNGEACAVISVWRFESSGACQSLWAMSDGHELVPLQDILCAVCWSETAENVARILVPYQFRGFFN